MWCTLRVEKGTGVGAGCPRAGATVLKSGGLCGKKALVAPCGGRMSRCCLETTAVLFEQLRSEREGAEKHRGLTAGCRGGFGRLLRGPDVVARRWK